MNRSLRTRSAIHASRAALLVHAAVVHVAWIPDLVRDDKSALTVIAALSRNPSAPPTVIAALGFNWNLTPIPPLDRN